MIARLLMLLLALQVLAVAALAVAARRYWQVEPLSLALLLAVAALLLGRLLITAQNFLLSWHYGSATPAPFALRTGQKLRLFAGEFWSTLLYSSWTMVRARAGQRIYPDRRALPVLLVHGYGCNSGYWARLTARLDALRISHASVDLEPVTAGIDDYVPQLARALEALCRDSGANEAVIVAHSMGGLAARALLRAHGNVRVARVITLGTPHDGTALANLGIGRNALQMRRRHGQASAWLHALAVGETAQQRALFHSIYTHHDNIIAPQTSCHLAGASNLALGGVGHVALGRDRRVLDAVVDDIVRSSAHRARRQTPV